MPKLEKRRRSLARLYAKAHTLSEAEFVEYFSRKAAAQHARETRKLEELRACYKGKVLALLEVEAPCSGATRGLLHLFDEQDFVDLQALDPLFGFDDLAGKNTCSTASFGEMLQASYTDAEQIRAHCIKFSDYDNLEEIPVTHEGKWFDNVDDLLTAVRQAPETCNAIE
jgi:hypothetical protein